MNHVTIKSLRPDDDNVSSEEFEGIDNTNENAGNTLASQLQSLSLSSSSSVDK